MATSEGDRNRIVYRGTSLSFSSAGYSLPTHPCFLLHLGSSRLQSPSRDEHGLMCYQADNTVLSLLEEKMPTKGVKVLIGDSLAPASML